MKTPLEEVHILSDEQEQESQGLIPIEQQTILFYGKPVVVVRLPDGQPGVVIRYLCDNLQLDPGAQVARIKRTEAIAEDVIYQIQITVSQITCHAAKRF